MLKLDIKSLSRIVCVLNFVVLVQPGYPPTGDEVLPGSVLLPATRRGRYLANIVRRQAIDGTGIKFNKDADRMNAEAKKKVDVLSDELLPYILAEQERRITLYKRVMSAIQNGEKGVTIVEIRNKSPLIVRKGLKFRCPRGRQPREPDGSGQTKCEGDIEPTMIMYDSCVDAEDKELFEANKKYFFCNRHRQEGADTPRTMNGTAAGPCGVRERTPLNYTLTKCVLEDTDDVVVHYRYYPDRSYKFVNELDPDHEVCDHWNPCQIGYIFSIASPERATIATDIFANEYDEAQATIDSESEENVEGIAEDDINEFVHLSAKFYEASTRRIEIPDGFVFREVRAKKTSDSRLWKIRDLGVEYEHEVIDGKYLKIKMIFPEDWDQRFYSFYYAVFVKGARRNAESKIIKFLVISQATMSVQKASIVLLPATIGNNVTRRVSVNFKCNKCQFLEMMLRNSDNHFINVKRGSYKVDNVDNKGKLEISLLELNAWDHGDFFAIIQNNEGNEEKIKVFSTIVPAPGPAAHIDLKLEDDPLAVKQVAVDASLDHTVKYTCSDCTMQPNIIFKGQNTTNDQISTVIQSQAKSVTFTKAVFQDDRAGVYFGIFEQPGIPRYFSFPLMIVENAAPTVSITSTINQPAPLYMEKYHAFYVKYSCEGECWLKEVHANGILLDTPPSTRRNMGDEDSGLSTSYYVWSSNSIDIRIAPEYTNIWQGVYTATFDFDGDVTVTKVILILSSASEPPKALRKSSKEVVKKHPAPPTSKSDKNDKKRPKRQPSENDDEIAAEQPQSTEELEEP